MAHPIVKMHSGRTERRRARLAQERATAVVSSLGGAEDSVSVAIEDVAPAEWTARVYEPDIQGRPETLYKKPGYLTLRGDQFISTLVAQGVDNQGHGARRLPPARIVDVKAGKYRTPVIQQA